MSFVVSPGLSISALIDMLDVDHRFSSAMRLRNGCVTTIRFSSSGRYEVLTVGDMRYLESGAAQ